MYGGTRLVGHALNGQVTEHGRTIETYSKASSLMDATQMDPWIFARKRCGTSALFTCAAHGQCIPFLM